MVVFKYVYSYTVTNFVLLSSPKILSNCSQQEQYFCASYCYLYEIQLRLVADYGVITSRKKIPYDNTLL